MEHFFGVAKEKGLGDDEIGIVQAIAMGVSAGRIRAQFRQVRKNIGYDECANGRAGIGQLLLHGSVGAVLSEKVMIRGSKGPV
jgi:hypothetical protein